uniref:BHLH domain-containing protein n=1 Tax=Biomphalaria glabrata TaxID=6526 RepID=A0A2C9K2F9_BIOGL
MTMATSTMPSPTRTGVSARKTNKPLMEKRRRARINDSLSQLKSLVIQSSKKDSSQFNKLEKADILELTVKYLRNLQSQQQEQISSNSEQSLGGKYQAGFMECANEVIRYLSQSQGFSDDTKARVVKHLASCIQLASKASFAKPVSQNISQGNAPAVLTTSQPASSGQLPNGQIVQIVNTQYQLKPQGLSQYPANAPVHQIPSSSLPSLQVSKPSSAEPTPYIRITQPLHIQIPPVLSPVLVQPKVVSKAPQQPISVKQERVMAVSTPSPVHERSQSPAPLPLTKHLYYQQEDEYLRSRTYSMTSSSSSESEMTSPLNLSQSPQFYDSRRDSSYAHSKYPSPQPDYHQTGPVSYSSDKLSPLQYKSDSGMYPGHYTSVIVDGRKGLIDTATLKYMNMVMEDDRHCFRQEGSTSPASSVGDERLWRPW